jgi:hypothetical protein
MSIVFNKKIIFDFYGRREWFFPKKVYAGFRDFDFYDFDFPASDIYIILIIMRGMAVIN